MIRFEKNRLKDLFNRFSDKSIAVIGDLMLDTYIWGKVSRISPEAPVPVVEVESESMRLGGAANVALNVTALGASAIPLGIIGDDSTGKHMKALFRENGFTTKGLFVDRSRPTTVKSRIIADSQHVVRTDTERRHQLSNQLKESIVSFLKSYKTQIQGIILEDYNKGVLSSDLIRDILSYADQMNIMTFVDPKYDHFFDYQHVTLFKPNRKEVENQLGISLKTGEDIEQAARKLFDRLQCHSILITLGEDGMMFFKPGMKAHHIPTRAMKVHDVSGAGDTVISTMAVAMISGASLSEAATLANHAAGIVCGEVGIVPIEKTRLLKTMLQL